jgi:eukaryotic-like serine/threonine-protein kinase
LTPTRGIFALLAISWHAAALTAMLCHLQFQAGLQAAEALEALHELAILHCDVSPTNVMRSASGVYKLADFGIARTCSATLRVTNTTNLYGNLAYMAPEQGISADADGARVHIADRSDVWALAATLLEAWSGARPYGSLTPQQIFVKHCSRAPPPLDVSARPLPPPLQRVLARCLDFDVAARPSAAELRRLRRLAQVLPPNALELTTYAVTTLQLFLTACERVTMLHCFAYY